MNAINFPSNTRDKSNCIKLTPLNKECAEKLYKRLDEEKQSFILDEDKISAYVIFHNMRALEITRKVIAEFDTGPNGEVKTEDTFVIQFSYWMPDGGVEKRDFVEFNANRRFEKFRIVPGDEIPNLPKNFIK